MRINFSKEEIALIKKAGVTFDVTKNIDNDAMFEIDDLVSEYLIYEGIDEDGSVTKDGKLCEDIIEKLVEE